MFNCNAKQYVAVSNFNDGELSMDGAGKHHIVYTIWFLLKPTLTSCIFACTPLDGIFGAGPDELTLSDNSEGRIMPTVLTNMKEKKLIEERSFSVFFEPRKNEYDQAINGQVTFGGGN